jgi:uncharacterized protein YyaL (SSP411 family)
MTRTGGKRWLVALLSCGVLAGGALWRLRPNRNAPAPVVAEAAAGASKPVSTNHLIGKTTPFLLLHAQNPIDWYPWGDEAFEKARREQKPIFLSVGYYTCHWCHVMEQESFTDPQIGAVLNRYFVSILVDREQRPDVDRLYMAYVEAATGSGGWPMNVFLTPDGKPFFGGTYFPKDDMGGQPGLRTILLRIAHAWQNDRSSVLDAANRAGLALQKILSAPVPDRDPLGPSVLDAADRQISSNYDATNGGFGSAPKFPEPVMLNFLFRYYARTGDKQAVEMGLGTLRAMARGGIHDQLGGGFHRYATDAQWRVPHFEKMLYDQAQLALAYLQAYQITHEPFYADMLRDILDFSLRDLRAPAGGFYSALDADSQIAPGNPRRGEGAFYLWRESEIRRTLGPESAAVFEYRFGVQPDGNIPSRQDFEGHFRGENVLYRAHSLAETAQHFSRPEAEIARELESAQAKLFAARAKRPHPPADAKIITAWNALMISALAQAGRALDQPRYLAAALETARLLETKLYDAKTGRLERSLSGGQAAVGGFLDDYAFLIQGLLDLYEASFDVHWLRWAVELQRTQDQLFWNAQQGGYFDTPPSDSLVLVRTREIYDGDEPSGNSVAAMNLLRLAQITDRADLKQKAEKTFAAFGQRLESNPAAMPAMAAALDFELSKPKQIVIAGKSGAPDTRALVRRVYDRFLPNKILLLADGGAGQHQLMSWLPFLSGVHEKGGRATAYICEDYVCKLPTADPEVVARLLDSKP